MSKSMQVITRETEENVQIDTYYLACSLTPDILAALLSDYCNLGGRGYREGLQVGRDLRCDHRTLQRLVITFAFGLLSGIAEQTHSDRRNAEALASAQAVKELLENGQLPFGLYL
jgi:hypothetical protein